jgi:glycerophosphoryl diester phosphodiesterase
MAIESKLMRDRPLLLGHRGARGQASVRENTIDAFDFALAQGCDGFEFDVRLSGDGQPVICHDAKVRNLKVVKTPAEKLKLSLLPEVLTRYRRKAFLDIELKVGGQERIASELLRELPPAREFVVSSFLPEVLEVLHALDSGIPLGLICETQSQLKYWRELPVDYVIPQDKLVEKKIVDEIKSAGKKIIVWTVNLTSEMKKFSQMGVDGIISDNPKRLVSAVRGLRNQRRQS